MARVGVGKSTGAQAQGAANRCREHACVISAAKFSIDPVQKSVQLHSVPSGRSDERSRNGHIKRSGDSFA